MISFSWLHDETFFPVTHVLMPFLLALYFPEHTWKVVAMIYIWETIETTLYWLFDSYGIFGFIDPGQESINDSLLLDPFQGILGILYFHLLPPPFHSPSNMKKGIASALLFLGVSSVLQWNPLEWIDIGYVFFILATCIFLYLHPKLGGYFRLHVLFFVCFPLIRITKSVVYRTWVAVGISLLVSRLPN